MTLPGAALSTGNYACLELELNAPASFTTGEGTPTAFIYASTQGAAVAQIDTNGYFMKIAGLTPAAGKLASVNSQTLRSLIGANTRYMVLSQTEDGLGLGTSSSRMALTYNGTKAMSVYTTTASENAGTSFEPVLFSTTLTGAGQVGGRVRAYMETNVALGGWANALKAEVSFGASGYVTGLASLSVLK